MTDTLKNASPQGYGPHQTERLPLLQDSMMNAEQRAAADAIINGPRKSLYGAFIPLLYAPALTAPVGDLGAKLRFEGVLSDAVRELTICVVARETSNQFEWQVHAPTAINAGVPTNALDSISVGSTVHGLPPDLQHAVDFTQELLRNHGVSDQTYLLAKNTFGEKGVMELTTLIGYFVMVCWVMNVAKTPGPTAAKANALSGLPN
ncbi:carboxymuconolactone decarboxylase family protein [Oxalicibacterium faecigallinarum]|uniref:Carboxymuconolactone decarboxylase family protein n=1 Tax=Oxalicibacterium faecigallinarum TaxID=573741 RepID=A0A8J3F3L6_9BURK|nr:carboxymuconolactone decarboxylase family protein [Oxalicibacterium faecigallinarum]GGI20476.1 hypothetical protein GCM10008066_24220 [Oxalicibacterium faecigallinarum]